jgi:hypothetical protein
MDESLSGIGTEEVLAIISQVVEGWYRKNAQRCGTVGGGASLRRQYLPNHLGKLCRSERLLQCPQLFFGQ